MPLFTPEEREQTAERVSRVLSDDRRVEGVVVGSLAHQADRCSDVDLVVLVGDYQELATVTADRVGRPYELLPVVHHFETAFGETLVRGFLLENLLELDLAFERTGRSAIWVPARVWCSTARGALRRPLMLSLKGSLSRRIGRARRGSHGTTSCTPAPQCGAAAPGRDCGTWSASETAP